MKTISIDVGNGYLKAVNQDGKTLHFPSVIKENHDKNILGASKNDYTISIDNTSYFMGNLALAKRAIRQWQSSKAVNADTALYVALCCHLLSDDSEINLCLGLPYSYYVELNKGEKLIKELTGKEFNTVCQGTTKQTKINHVSVYPQGVGAYFSSLYDIDGKPLKGAVTHIRAMFIDIGYRTVDVVAFDCLDKEFELIQESSFSLEEFGIFKAINEISSIISENNEVNPNDVEYAIQNNKSVIESMYGDIDLTDAEQKAYKHLAKRITNEINIKLSGEIQRFKNLYLTGGGAAKLYPFISEVYPNLKLQDDYIFCNAKGYLALENTK